MSNQITKEEFLNLSGQFLWGFGQNWLIKTSIGKFHWSDSEYPGGTNTIQEYFGTEELFLQNIGSPYFRDKGETFIKNRVPETVQFI